MRDNAVDRHRPKRHEHHPGRELGAVGDGAADQGGGDDREAQLERGEQQFGNSTVRGFRTYPLHPGVRQSAEEPARATVGERQAVTDQQPRHRHQWNGDEAHHDHVEHATGAHHAPVEDRQPRRHQQDECGACQQPAGSGGIDVQLSAPSKSSMRISARCCGGGRRRHSRVQRSSMWLTRSST